MIIKTYIEEWEQFEKRREQERLAAQPPEDFIEPPNQAGHHSHDEYTDDDADSSFSI